MSLFKFLSICSTLHALGAARADDPRSCGVEMFDSVLHLGKTTLVLSMF